MGPLARRHGDGVRGRAVTPDRYPPPSVLCAAPEGVGLDFAFGGYGPFAKVRSRQGPKDPGNPWGYLVFCVPCAPNRSPNRTRNY